MKHEWSIFFSKKEFLERLGKACTEERRLERNDYIWGPYLKYNLKKGTFRLYFIKYNTNNILSPIRFYGKVVEEMANTETLVRGEFRELKVMRKFMSIFFVAGVFLIFNREYIFGLYFIAMTGIFTVVFTKVILKVCEEGRERLLDLIDYVIEMQKRD